MSRREAEIFATQRDIQQKSDLIFSLRKDTDTLQFELQKQKEEKVRD